VSVTAYAFPWDFLDDPAAASRALEVGVDAVALAATYHATRVVSPLHPFRRVTEVPESACYVPIRAEAWRGRRLVPRPPVQLDGADSFNEAERQLAEVGLSVDAWIVLTHLDDAGYEHPDLVVRNAFGEPYPYALCPSAEDVRDYCVTLVEETLRTTSARGVVLEACGPMGFEHSGFHDKSEVARPSPTDIQLLSICFCAACQLALSECGVDHLELAVRVREALFTGAWSCEDALGEELAERVATFRTTVGADLRHAIVERIRSVRPDARITLHASARRWATGSFLAVSDNRLAELTTIVANCWDPATADGELRALATLARGDTGLGAYLRMDRGWSVGAVASEKVTRYATTGASELHLYHLGLLSLEGLDHARRLTNVFKGRALNARSHSAVPATPLADPRTLSKETP